MSRAKARAKRIPNDYYPTPAWCVDRLLEAWAPMSGPILEPCAGDGAIIRAFREAGDQRPFVAIELRLETANSLTTLADKTYAGHSCLEMGNIEYTGTTIDTILTNPPYTKAAEIILHHRQHYPWAEIVMLLRLGFLESENRRQFWAEMGAADLYVLPNRPSFTGGGNDSASYAWFSWPDRHPRKSGNVQILRYTPKHIRLADRAKRSRQQISKENDSAKLNATRVR